MTSHVPRPPSMLAQFEMPSAVANAIGGLA